MNYSGIKRMALLQSVGIVKEGEANRLGKHRNAGACSLPSSYPTPDIQQIFPFNPLLTRSTDSWNVLTAISKKTDTNRYGCC